MAVPHPEEIDSLNEALAWPTDTGAGEDCEANHRQSFTASLVGALNGLKGDAVAGSALLAEDGRGAAGWGAARRDAAGRAGELGERVEGSVRAECTHPWFAFLLIDILFSLLLLNQNC